MNEFIEKLIGRLEEEKSDWNNDYNVPINKAIEIINELAEEYSHCTLCYLQGPCEYQNENVQMQMEYWERGWIPCENELPKLEGRYLCSYNYKDGGRNYVQVLSYYANDKKPHFQHEGYQGLEVVAWQPLPAPYNTKGK